MTTDIEKRNETDKVLKSGGIPLPSSKSLQSLTERCNYFKKYDEAQDDAAVVRAIAQMSMATGMELSEDRMVAIVCVLRHRGVSDVRIIWAAGELAARLTADYAKKIAAKDFMDVLDEHDRVEQSWRARKYVN